MVRDCAFENGRCIYCGYKTSVSGLRRNCLASRGLGDTIAKITSAIGIKPCGGCKKRQELLNRIFPYHKETS